jgi:hypothetical protein
VAAAVAAIGAVVLVACATGLGNGAVGTERLAAVGPQVPPLLWSLLLELVVGAALWTGWRAVRRHRRRAEAGQASTHADRAKAT